MAGKPFDLVAVGDVMLDVVLPAPVVGTRVHAPITVTAGGSAVNAARAAARLGARAAVVGSVGEDAAGRAIVAELEALGIDAFLTVVPGRPTGTVVYAGDDVVADRGANADCAVGALPAARVTLVSAYLPAAAARAAVAGASGMSAIDLQGAGSDTHGADVVLSPDRSPEELAGSAPVTCSTLGARGAIAVRGSERASAEPERVLDGPVPGAGDAFAAGFLLALADDLPLGRAVARGCAAVLGLERPQREREQRDPNSE